MHCHVVGAFLSVCAAQDIGPAIVWEQFDPLLAKHGLGPDDRDFWRLICYGGEFLTSAKCAAFALRNGGTPLADALEELTGQSLPALRTLCNHLDRAR